jgi:L-alanine-DL-glutamate epimerase-like enolase superfamily enzyme
VKLEAHDERWPIAGAFTISRGSKTEAHVVVATVSANGHVGRGECVPYARYGETVEHTLAEIAALSAAFERGVSREQLQTLAPANAARNALDCALWDLEAKMSGRPAWRAAGLDRLEAVETCFTISLGSPEKMAHDASAAAHRPILKVKLGGGDDLACVEAVRAAAPFSRLVVDPNEALGFDDLVRLAPEFKRLGVVMIEQPLKAGEDEALEGYDCPVPLCADESLHTRDDLALCARRYRAIAIKLDKTGGLTEALAMVAQAERLGLQVMAGCMVATSLAMAPAALIAQNAAVVDLDGPLLLARDRADGLVYDGSLMHPPAPALWG